MLEIGVFLYLGRIQAIFICFGPDPAIRVGFHAASVSC